VSYTQLAGSLLLKGSYRGAEDELLVLKHLVQGGEQFLMERLILAFQVQHGDRLKGGMERVTVRFHASMVAAERPGRRVLGRMAGDPD